MKKEITSKLFKYGAAAGAGAFSVSSANAAIAYQSALDGFVPVTLVNGSADFGLDIDGDTDEDINFAAFLAGGTREAISAFSTDGDPLAPSDTDNKYPFGFAFTETIDSSAFGPSDAGRINGILGQWAPGNYLINNVTDGFLGVEFDNGGNTHYGWVRVEISSPASGQVQLDITAYGWETTAGQGIAAGAVPEPSNYALGLGLLALGAAGVRTRRRTA